MDRSLLEKAEAAQKLLADMTVHQEGIVGIGIGVTEDRCGPELEVMVESDEVTPSIPSEIEGVPVRLNVVGKVRAY